MRVSFKGLLIYEPMSEIVTPRDEAVEGLKGTSGVSPSYELRTDTQDLRTPRFELLAFLIMFE